MSSTLTPELQYFHYKVFDDGLAILPKDAISADPSVGRVLRNRIQRPTVGIFKRAIARLEGTNPSRFAALRFSTAGDEVSDDVALADWGLAPDQPLLISLSRIINGVAEPILSPSEPGKVAFPEKPVGWTTAQVPLVNKGQLIIRAPLYETIHNPLRETELTVSLRSRDIIFVHPLSAKCQKVRQKNTFHTEHTMYLGIHPSERSIGYLSREHIVDLTHPMSLR